MCKGTSPTTTQQPAIRKVLKLDSMVLYISSIEYDGVFLFVPQIKEVLVMQSIKSLLDLPGRIYLFFDSVETKQLFMQHALNENITFGDGVIVTDRNVSDIMVLETNATIHYPGYIGTLWFYTKDARLTRIDYAKWINNKNNYIIQK